MADKRIAAIIIVVLLVSVSSVIIVAALPSDGPLEPVMIVQKGSDTMFELCLEMADGYHSHNKHVTVNVSGGGSGVGIKAFMNGSAQIAQSSRPMTAQELQDATISGMDVIELPIAIDGITIIAHGGNPVADLTVEELRGIFNGTYHNWSEVGGADLPIVLFGRHNTSGTYAFFKEHVLLNGGYSPSMIEEEGNTAIVNDVMSNAGGIGYVGLGYVSGGSSVRVMTLQRDHSTPAYSPLDENAVVNGSYVLSRYLYFYIDGQPQGAMKDYLRWVISSDGGQAIAVQVGFYALPSVIADRDLAKIG